MLRIGLESLKTLNMKSLVTISALEETVEDGKEFIRSLIITEKKYLSLNGLATYCKLRKRSIETGAQTKERVMKRHEVGYRTYTGRILTEADCAVLNPIVDRMISFEKEGKDIPAELLNSHHIAYQVICLA